ncbi:MAG TPA: lipoyl domain-containing protein, partial [Candidatus Binatia bacterium]|nr:lipoyl domain-containing protein [Candidatus Binatia bacterium]
MAVSRVVMPKLSEQMETGKIIKWLKSEGDRIQAGDILAEVETDKADVEMEAFGAGVLRKILVAEGDRAPIGALIAVIAESSDDIASVVAAAGGAATSGAPSSRPAAVPPQPRAEDHATVERMEPAARSSA